jgi:hypothetical protein
VLIGVIDETGVLEEGEVFVQTKADNYSSLQAENDRELAK